MSAGSSFTEGPINMRSNGDINEEFLNGLLGSNNDIFNTIPPQSDSKFGGNSGQARSHTSFLDTDVSVDITLRTQFGQAPLVMLLITLPETNADDQEKGFESKLHRVYISFEIKLNGYVNVTQVTGLGGVHLDKDQPKSEATPEMLKLYKKLNRILEISEDLSVLVEYVVGQLRAV